MGCFLACVLVMSARAAPLRVIYPDSILSFPHYVSVAEGGGLQGKLVDFWDCVFDGVGVAYRNELMPPRRASHELMSGRADLFVAKVKGGDGQPIFNDAMNGFDLGGGHYTDLVGYVNEVLLVQESNAALLSDDHWLQQRVVVLKASVNNQRLRRAGRAPAVEAGSFEQALKILVSGRADVLLVNTMLAGEVGRSYQGHKLLGRTLRAHGVHGLLSDARHRANPDLLANVNLQIGGCRQLNLASPAIKGRL